MRDAGRSRRGDDAGFSIIELVVVVGIIGVMAGIALPAIARYIKVYKIRGAAAQVAGNLQTARNRAISKNANFGVDLVVENNNTYWIHHEDDQSTAHTTVRKTLNFAAPVTVQSAKFNLPIGIQFATTTTQCPGLTSAPTTGWMQYERLGNLCTAGCGTTPSTSAPTNVIFSDATVSRICLYEPTTKLTRLVEVVPGGRVIQR